MAHEQDHNKGVGLPLAMVRTEHMVHKWLHKNQACYDIVPTMWIKKYCLICCYMYVFYPANEPIEVSTYHEVPLKAPFILITDFVKHTCMHVCAHTHTAPAGGAFQPSCF